jgi:hypothetical protein
MGTSYNPSVNFLVNEGLCSNIFKPTHHSLIKFCSSKWSYLVTSFKHILGEINWRHNCILQIAISLHCSPQLYMLRNSTRLSFQSNKFHVKRSKIQSHIQLFTSTSRCSLIGADQLSVEPVASIFRVNLLCVLPQPLVPVYEPTRYQNPQYTS